MIPKISVIVPVYNTPCEDLKKCIESIINQTLKEIEIILVNDGSTNGNLEILKEYARKDKRIVLIDQQNQGVSASRNAGINIAKGQYIGFVDSDDWIEDNYYELLYASAIKENADIAVAENIVHLLNREFPLIERSFGASIWNKLFKLNIIKKNKIYFDTSITWCEDMTFNFIFCFFSKKEIFVKDCIYYYRRDQEYSLTERLKRQKLADTNLARRAIVNFYNNLPKNQKIILLSLKLFLETIMTWPTWSPHQYKQSFMDFHKIFAGFKYIDELIRQYPIDVFNYILIGSLEKFYEFINNNKKRLLLKKLWDKNFEPFIQYVYYLPSHLLNARKIFQILKTYIANINSVIEINDTDDIYKNQFKQIFTNSAKVLNYSFPMPKTEKELNKKFDLAIAVPSCREYTSQTISQMTDFLTNVSDIILFSSNIFLYEGKNFPKPQGYYQSLFAQKGFICFDIFRKPLWNLPFISWDIKQGLILYVKSDKADIFKQKGLEPSAVLADIYCKDYVCETFENAKNNYEIRIRKYRKRYQRLILVSLIFVLIILAILRLQN